MYIDFQKVFDKILELAVNENSLEEKMIKMVFVFSNTEFDQASESPWEMDYMLINRKSQAKGYTNVPIVVFWNVGYYSASHVLATQNGVVLVSGFSNNLLTFFLKECGIIKPGDARNFAGEDVKKRLSTASESRRYNENCYINGGCYPTNGVLPTAEVAVHDWITPTHHG
ncbi:Uncharacterized conserved protein UCP015417 [Abeliophyllum distichum]|uniref:Uncharacterized conserved protein UCP015417 n=1 Tax=Abeliophyllum distichum TaxID=126358 RepID=A0ABD1T1J7_9LAMI